MSVKYVFPDVENADQNPAWSEISSYYAAEGAAYMATAGELAATPPTTTPLPRPPAGSFSPSARSPATASPWRPRTW